VIPLPQSIDVDVGLEPSLTVVDGRQRCALGNDGGSAALTRSAAEKPVVAGAMPERIASTRRCSRLSPSPTFPWFGAD
jgi:hypothetical protein